MGAGFSSRACVSPAPASGAWVPAVCTLAFSSGIASSRDSLCSWTVVCLGRGVFRGMYVYPRWGSATGLPVSSSHVEMEFGGGMFCPCNQEFLRKWYRENLLLAGSGWSGPAGTAVPECWGLSLSRVWFRQDFETAAQWVDISPLYLPHLQAWRSGWLPNGFPGGN